MKRVTAAVLVDDDHLLIAQRSIDDKLAGLWELPGGKIEPGESPEDCLKREMMEEFEIVVEVGEFFDRNIYEYDDEVIELLAYWCRWVGGEFNPTVHQDYRWLRLNDYTEYEFAPADLPLIEKIWKVMR